MPSTDQNTYIGELKLLVETLFLDEEFVHNELMKILIADFNSLHIEAEKRSLIGKFSQKIAPYFPEDYRFEILHAGQRIGNNLLSDHVDSFKQSSPAVAAAGLGIFMGTRRRG